MLKFKKAAVLVGLAAGLAPASWAGAVITYGNVSMGINNQGHLNFGGVGINYAGVGDGIYPGCLCEGWGVSGNTTSAWASIDNGGINGINNISFSSTASTATSMVGVSGLTGLTVQHAFAPSAAAGLFEVVVTISNGSSSSIADLRYSRSMDWDIPPTVFNEFVTINRGSAANLIFSNDNGFAVPNPRVNPSEIVGGTNNTSFVDAGPADHGAFFTFGFGSIAAGESKVFKIFYGATESEATALAALGTVAAEVYSLGQNSRTPLTGTPATFVFGFSGVGGDPVIPSVPEPSTWAMMVAGLGAAAAARRRAAR